MVCALQASLPVRCAARTRLPDSATQAARSVPSALNAARGRASNTPASGSTVSTGPQAPPGGRTLAAIALDAGPCCQTAACVPSPATARSTHPKLDGQPAAVTRDDMTVSGGCQAPPGPGSRSRLNRSPGGFCERLRSWSSLHTSVKALSGFATSAIAVRWRDVPDSGSGVPHAPFSGLNTASRQLWESEQLCATSALPSGATASSISLPNVSPGTSCAASKLVSPGG